MLTFRPATLADAPFVARGVIMALHLDPEQEDMSLVTSICSREDVLYSWRNTLLACVDGLPVGLCLCYDGKDYHETRIRTFQLFSEGKEGEEDDMDLANMEDETGPGEYYIDSLAVMPEFRRQGIARQLMLAQLEIGRKMGLHKATLLVDPANPSAQSLYHQCGFVHDRDIYAFGQIYWKWEVTLSDVPTQ